MVVLLEGAQNILAALSAEMSCDLEEQLIGKGQLGLPEFPEDKAEPQSLTCHGGAFAAGHKPSPDEFST